MNNSEFNEWFAIHQKAFGLNVRTQTAGTQVADLVRDQEVIRLWRDTLQSVSLDDAKEATRRILANEALHPKSFKAHPAAVLKVARDISSTRYSRSGSVRKYVGGEEVFDCGFCRDSGHVVILAPRFVEAVRRGLIKREPFTVPSTSNLAKSNNWRWGELVANGGLVRAVTFAVACCCEKGRPDNFRGAVFDPDRHYTGDVPRHPDELANFEAHLRSLNELQPANYVNEFDAYNAGF